jgi:hypothetical protein
LESQLSPHARAATGDYGYLSSKAFHHDSFPRCRLGVLILTEATINDHASEKIPGWQSLGLEPGKRIALLLDQNSTSAKPKPPGLPSP